MEGEWPIPQTLAIFNLLFSTLALMKEDDFAQNHP
jgi:hypothetical protein